MYRRRSRAVSADEDPVARIRCGLGVCGTLPGQTAQELCLGAPADIKLSVANAHNQADGTQAWRKRPNVGIIDGVTCGVGAVG